MRLRYLLAVALMFSMSLAARADTLLYTFSFSGSGFSGSGTFSLTSDSNPGEYKITSIFGTTTVQGGTVSNISGLLPAGTYPANTPDYPDQANDNLAFNSGDFLDYQGVSYQLTNGLYVNLFSEGGGQFGILYSGSGSSFDLTTFSATPVVTPEPSSFLLLGTGLLGMAGFLRKRSIQNREVRTLAAL